MEQTMQTKVRNTRLNISVDNLCASLWYTLGSALSIVKHKLRFKESIICRFTKTSFYPLIDIAWLMLLVFV